MKRLLFLGGIIGLAWLTIATFSCNRGSQKNPSPQDSILSVVKKYLDWEGQNGFSGVVMVKIKDQPTLVASYGYAIEDQLIENAPDIAFDIGWFTKQFTSTAILKLEMMGRLKVTDSLGKYFPELALDKNAITLHQLMTHTSGLPARSGRGPESVTKEQLLERLSLVKLIAPPGDSVLFSDFGYNVLGLVIEKASGVAYEEFLNKYLFEPVGMKQTGYVLPNWVNEKIAHGYWNCKDWGKPTDLNWSDDGPYWNLKGSGGLLSTGNDLLAWHEALKGDLILNTEAKEKLYHPYVKQEQGYRGYFGYGWKIFTSSRNTTVYAHNSFNGRYFTDFLNYVEDDVTILVLSNKFSTGNPSISFEIASCIFTKGHRPVVHGRLTLCLDSLPDNRPGQVAGELLKAVNSNDRDDLKSFMKGYVASHLMNKYPEDKIYDFLLNQIASSIRGGIIESAKLTDYKLLDIVIFVPATQKRYFLNLVLDENEDYKIRGFGIDESRRPFQG